MSNATTVALSDKFETPKTSSSEPSTVGFNSRDATAQLVEELQHYPFTSSQSLRKTLEHRRKALQHHKTRDQYLVFTGIPTAEFSRLSDDRSPASKYSRFSYSAETGTLVAKVMPTPEHDIAARSFELIIGLELHSMGLEDDVDSLGSTTVTIGSWKREADCCWAPASQTTELSFVVEVGLSNSARQLALDARGWLETRTSSVKLVVTIDINRTNPEVIMHRWELFPRDYRLLTRSSSLSARRSAALRLSRMSNTTFVTGESHIDGTGTAITQLYLSFEKVIGRPPNPPLERDLVISEQTLRNFAEKIWRKQGFL